MVDRNKMKKDGGSSDDAMIRAEAVLRSRFHYPSFREGQKEIISSLLQGSDVFAMLPTGGGKSLCYEIPGYILDGLVVIVSPLISLMEDQTHALREIGETRVRALNSMVHPQEQKRILGQLGSLRFLYLSPEMLRRPRVIDALTRVSVALFVIDEAHCVSQWGHEFRPDYLHLAGIREQLNHPVCLALTATADQRVKEDILHYLHLKDACHIMMGVDRPNIAMSVIETENVPEKTKELLGLLHTVRLPGIVYCSGRVLTMQLADLIGAKLHLRTAYYHGGMYPEDRRKIQNQFLEGSLDVLCCTSAFGMGINKPDIRLVVHYQYPANLNAYLQEIGRAARDGGPGLAVLLHAPEDDLLPVSLIEANYPSEPLMRLALGWISRGLLDPGKQPNAFRGALMQSGAGETAARFLTDQLQELPPGISATAALQKVLRAVHERKQTQFGDLEHMKAWIHTKRCRREACLEFFDEKLTRKPAHCCDRCGISISDFANERQTNRKSHVAFDWRRRLTALLLTEK
ncbi:RecQ family ATP-dependent DNA helicase [Sporolactobacillus vineae]|uniref:RecQ family ATP-dependent DNA helicase n=1 Tax=Sporolactobacillus vineae TaxID=444463 RepID=UPI0002893748|nr:ATP-dependent DNA helicase RecQ [Sporolactobacillus vineae]